MYVTTARYPTAHASKYLQQLCKHFAHKVEVEHDETTGRSALMSGVAEMRADADALHVRITAEDPKSVIQTRFAIDSHLVTFAHREGFLGLSWQMETEAKALPAD
ncbi:DUF2218 domain-containing protein [Frigidibacter albus]|uniref:DUF2218 domain-containing protein n=1 Tax=Frigidibacter albus TaxID=1465486 RepID=A0A6L8VBJ5_9RHOB|nr:DUF2218 domain-containing protein [Frigidibacter albus]MZQ87707.1 DUF2218 domain-containing protein [Frigidibacter albus]NBE29613.1 DUF2218 domain-containing protein [Frigidibacter albus]GGH43807.1 hypothetical protein GCM10011341_02690 [Frigidibacter albus]